MLLTSENICQARIIRASWKKRMCSKATVRANNSWSRRRVSRDKAKGDKSQELLAFYSKKASKKCKKQAKGLKQEGENGEMAAKGSGGQVGGCYCSPRQRSQISSSNTDMGRNGAIWDVILEAESTKVTDRHIGEKRTKEALCLWLGELEAKDCGRMGPGKVAVHVTAALLSHLMLHWVESL